MWIPNSSCLCCFKNIVKTFVAIGLRATSVVKFVSGAFLQIVLIFDLSLLGFAFFKSSQCDSVLRFTREIHSYTAVMRKMTACDKTGKAYSLQFAFSEMSTNSIDPSVFRDHTKFCPGSAL